MILINLYLKMRVADAEIDQEVVGAAPEGFDIISNNITGYFKEGDLVALNKMDADFDLLTGDMDPKERASLQGQLNRAIGQLSGGAEASGVAAAAVATTETGTGGFAAALDEASLYTLNKASPFSTEMEVEGVKFRVGLPAEDSPTGPDTYEIYFPQIDLGSDGAEGINDQIIRLNKNREFAQEVATMAEQYASINTNPYAVYRLVRDYVEENMSEEETVA